MEMKDEGIEGDIYESNDRYKGQENTCRCRILVSQKRVFVEKIGFILRGRLKLQSQHEISVST
jgi:hypothetical protein